MKASTGRRQAQKIATRNSLLDAAAALVAVRGYGDASVAAIAAKAGFTKGALYAHFKSKDALMLAVAERFEERWLVAQSELIESAGPAELAEAWFADVDRDRVWALFEREIWLFAMRNPQFASHLAARYERTRHRIAAGIAARNGRSAAEERDLSAAAVILALDIGLSTQLLLGHDVDPAGMVDVIVDHILRSAGEEG
jgi:TetR/AcrR family transcriptional regulator, transcriptional repressor of aconitase